MKTKARGGKYYQKLSHVSLAITVVVSLFLFALCTLIIIQVREREDNTRETVMQSVWSQMNTTISLAFSTLRQLENNPDLSIWLDATNPGEFYYEATVLRSLVSKASSAISPLTNSYAIIASAHDGFSITPRGSCTYDWFFEHEIGLAKEEQERIEKHFSTANSDLVLPVYGDDDTLKSLLIFHEATSLGMQKALLVAVISLEGILIPSAEAETYLASYNGIIIPSRRTGKALPSLMGADAKSFLTKPLSDSSWILFMRFHSLAHATLIIPIGAILILIAGGLFFLMAQKRQVKKLYQPIEDLISIEDREEKDVDEFALLKAKNERLTILSKELKAVMTEKEALETTQKGRSLLEGALSEEDKMDERSYFVALIRLEPLTEANRLSYLQLTLEATARLNGQITFVPSGNDGGSVILCTDNQKGAKKILRTLIAPIEDECECIIALSDEAKGRKEIKDQFKLALEIMEYRANYPGWEFLTSSECLPAESMASYYYPLATERQLLSLLTQGNPEVKEYLRQILDENLIARTLSASARNNFLDSLIRTLQRAYQELKSSPEALIGHTIDWEELHRECLCEQDMETIIQSFTALASAVHAKTDLTDSHIIEEMKNYIQKNYHYDIMLQDLADHFNLTAKYCGMLFARLSNDTFKNYLNAYRVEMAKQQIAQEPHIKINDLADKVGFNSATSFIRVFRKYTGTSPRLYADGVARIVRGETI